MYPANAKPSGSGWIDISVPLGPNLPVWPGDPPVIVERVSDVANGDDVTLTKLICGSHCGTHVDAFNHFSATGRAVDEIDLNGYIGRAYVVELPEAQCIDEATTRGLLALIEAQCGADDLQDAQDSPNQRPTRLLFKTRNSNRPWYQEAFNPDFVAITPEAAHLMVAWGVTLVGADYLSVEQYTAVGAPTHRVLLEAGVLIVEGLYLAEIPGGWVEFACLPLKLAGADGAPARACVKLC
ncbi:MAG: cyclase family protein [Vampirovibrionales bacterium]|nr:cyclase family protein [Vampirovibrionales bacterium]